MTTGYRTSARKKTAQALQPVSKAMRPVLKKVMPKHSEAFHQLFDLWADLTAGTEAQGTIPEKLAFARGSQKQGVLSIWSKTGAQATEVTFNQSILLQKINTVFGYALVGDLRVTAFPTVGKPALKESNKRGKGSAALTCQSLDKSLSDISNPSLKAALADLGGLLDSNLPLTTSSKGEQHA